MIQIKEAVLVRFGKFENYTLHFPDGLQVIFGGNEAGKSTLQLFFKAMIYGVAGNKKDERGLKSRERMIPWNEKNAEGILRLLVDGKEIEIRRKFGKTASGDKTEVLDVHTGSVLPEYDPKCLGEQLFGMPESLFEKTFWLHQDGACFGDGDDVLNQRLLNLLETGAEDVSAEKTMVWLEKEKRAIKAKDRRSNPGLLDRCREEREEKLKERYQLLSDMKQRDGEEKRLLMAQEKAEKAKSELMRLQKMAEQKSHIVELDAIRKKIEQVKRLEELARQVESREEYQKFFSLEETDVEKAEILEKKIETLDQTAVIEYDIKKAEERIAGAKKQEKTGGLILLLGIVLLLISAGLSLVYWVITILGGFVSVFLIGIGFWQNHLAKKMLWQNLEEKNKMQTAKNGEFQEQEQLRTELKEILSRYQCGTAGELRDGFLKCRQAKMEKEGYWRTYETLLEGEPLETLQSKVQEMSEFSNQYESLLHIDLEQEIQKFQEMQVAAVSEIKESEGKLSYVFHGNRNPADVETEIIQIDEQIAEYEKREKALDLATSVFARVHEKRKFDFTPLVNEKVNGFLDILTGGKYQDVRVSAEYQIKLFPDEHHLYPAEYFSKGTYEQTYFALRLSLGSLLGNGTEPLFLDDFLMAYDDKRAEAAFELLQELSKERQIFLFSCHQRDVKNADKIKASIHCLEEE